MRKIAVMDTRTIVIGRVGENEAAQVVWPGLLAKWRGLYGEGTVQLAVRRPLDKLPYPVVCAADGDNVTWTVSAADTAQNGTGECELSYLVGDTVAKSQTWATMILRSLTGDEPGEPPEDPAKAWFAAIQSQIGDLADLTTKAKDNLVAAINEAAKSGSGGGGSVEMRVADGYIQYSTDGVTWENLIAVADLKGDTGPQGPQGETGPQGPQGDTGAKGAAGDAGPKGADGTTFTPSVDASGNLSWTNDGGKANPAEVNIKGPKGDQGEQGPQGETGPQGPQGEQGPAGPVNIPTTTNLLKGDGSGGMSAATAGTDYTTPANVRTILNRTNNVNVANTSYTTYMARGEALFSTETTPTVNGCIAWQYG